MALKNIEYDILDMPSNFSRAQTSKNWNLLSSRVQDPVVRPCVQIFRVQESRVQVSKHPESKPPEFKRPSLQASRVQSSRAWASKCLRSKRPESKLLESKSPERKLPEHKCQTMRPEPTFSGMSCTRLWQWCFFYFYFLFRISTNKDLIVSSKWSLSFLSSKFKVFISCLV